MNKKRKRKKNKMERKLISLEELASSNPNIDERSLKAAFRHLYKRDELIAEISEENRKMLEALVSIGKEILNRRNYPELHNGKNLDSLSEDYPLEITICAKEAQAILKLINKVEGN